MVKPLFLHEGPNFKELTPVPTASPSETSISTPVGEISEDGQKNVMLSSHPWQYKVDRADEHLADNEYEYALQQLLGAWELCEQRDPAVAYKLGQLQAKLDQSKRAIRNLKTCLKLLQKAEQERKEVGSGLASTDLSLETAGGEGLWEE